MTASLPICFHTSMRNNKSFFAGLTMICVLTAGCEKKESRPDDQAFLDSKNRGDIQGVHRELTQLASTDPTSYQATLKQVELAIASLNKAQAELPNDAFVALELAIESDQKYYNEPARDIIKSVLNPYKDLLRLHLELRQWGTLPYEVMLVDATIPQSLQTWTEAIHRPHLWPDNEFIRYLSKKRSQVFRLRAMAKVQEEYKAIVEIYIRAQRLQRKVPDDERVKLMAKDVDNVIQFYNHLISYMDWHYMSRDLKTLIEANESLIAQVKELKNRNVSTRQWLANYQQIVENTRQDVDYSYSSSRAVIGELFKHFQNPTPFVTEVQTLNQVFTQMIVDNFGQKLTPEQAMQLAQKHNESYHKTLQTIDALVAKMDKKAIVDGYLSSLSAWQYDDFNGLEALLPHLRDYRTVLQGY